MTTPTGNPIGDRTRTERIERALEEARRIRSYRERRQNLLGWAQVWATIAQSFSLLTLAVALFFFIRSV